MPFEFLDTTRSDSGCGARVFALCLLSPAYYAKYFDDGGRLNLQGEIAMSGLAEGRPAHPAGDAGPFRSELVERRARPKAEL